MLVENTALYLILDASTTSQIEENLESLKDSQGCDIPWLNHITNIGFIKFMRNKKWCYKANKIVLLNFFSKTEQNKKCAFGMFLWNQNVSADTQHLLLPSCGTLVLSNWQILSYFLLFKRYSKALGRRWGLSEQHHSYISIDLKANVGQNSKKNWQARRGHGGLRKQ